MLALFFANAISVVTTAVLIAILAFAFTAYFKRASVQKWGRLLLVLILIGTAASATSAVRDSYAAPGALFPMDGAITLLCGVAGGIIYLMGFVCLFWRRQNVRRAGFFIAALLMAVQIVAVEGSRILFLMGAKL